MSSNPYYEADLRRAGGAELWTAQVFQVWEDERSLIGVVHAEISHEAALKAAEKLARDYRDGHEEGTFRLDLD